MKYRTRKRPIPKSPPMVPKTSPKKESEEESEEKAIELLLKYILGIVLIMGGKDNEETRQQIFDIMVFSGQLSEVSDD